MTDHVFLRASPDWLNLDLADTRVFLRSFGYQEDLLERFVTLWDANFALDYRTFRHRLTQVTLDNVAAIGCPIVRLGDDAVFADDDRVAFLDDDDWFAPDLFARLPDTMPGNDGIDGWRWGSIRIGLDYDPTAPNASMVDFRPLSTRVYTNNYAVSGRMIARGGLSSLFQHGHAHGVFAADPAVVLDSSDYLSCAVKHPCATTAVKRLMVDEGFLRDPVALVRVFVERLESAPIPPESTWLADPIARLRDVMGDALPA